MLSKQELERLTMKELKKERNRTQERVDELQSQARCLKRLGLRDEARLRCDARVAGKKYLLMIERELERRNGK